MLRSALHLRSYQIAGTDGGLGKIKDLLFDDRLWVVRYLVADSGSWLPGRRVLIPPAVVEQPDWDERVLPVNLTRNQIKESPGLDEDRPVSRQHEVEMHAYYGWAPYWAGPAGLHPPVVPPQEADLIPETERGDPSLRSCVEVTGYRVSASDGALGQVEDLIVDDEGWPIRYAVVGTKTWLPGRKILIPPRWVRSFSWDERRAALELTCEQIKNGPEYNPADPINRAYEARLYDYYGRPRYWT